MIDTSTGEIVQDVISDVPVPFFRTPYNYDAGAVSIATGLHCADLSLAVQDGLEDADINKIIAKFNITGQLPEGLHAPMWGQDLLSAPKSFQDAMNIVREGELVFSQMPAAVRNRFSNDPASFVDFCSDPANLGQLRDWKLLSATQLDSLDKADAQAALEASYRSGDRKRPATLDDVVAAVKTPKGG